MSLTTLPVELLLSVTSYLTTPDYSSLRLTCKALRDASQQSWATEFFTTRQFSLQTFSLETLVAIAQDPSLASLVKRLIIATDYVPLRNPGGYTQSSQKHIELLIAQHYSRNTGLDKQMLASAISRLPNLSTIEIKNFWSSHQGGRKRDDGPWKTYGWQTLKQAGDLEGVFSPSDVDEFDHLPTRKELYFSHVFQKVAAAAVECASLKALNVHLRRDQVHPSYTPGLQAKAFEIPAFAAATYRNGFAHLEQLMLRIGNDRSSGMAGDEPDLVAFTQYTPHLRWLRLNWQDYRDHPQFFLEKLKEMSLNIPLLARLDIGTVTVPDTLFSAMSHFKQLNHLSLFFVNLKNSTWETTLRSLPAELPALREISLDRLSQRCRLQDYTWTARVAFKTRPDMQVDSIADAGLQPAMIVSDKRDQDLASAMDKVLQLMVVDDEEFRRANGLLDGVFDSDLHTDPEDSDEADSDVSEDDVDEDLTDLTAAP